MAVRRPAAPVAAPAPVAQAGVGFGSLGFYSGGFQLPEGDWAMEFNAIIHQPTNSTTGAPVGAPRLGIMVTAHPLQGGEAHEQFYSMGTKAHDSFVPDASTGKSLVPVPGGSGASLNNKTNWFMFLKSLYDCGLPEGIFDNDLSVLDGVWVHTQNVPEPADRKDFAAKTGEAAQAQTERKGSGLVAIVTEIKDGGKPWEGSGGIPQVAATAAQLKPVLPGRPVVGPTRVAARPAAVVATAAPPAEAAGGDEDVQTAAINGVTAVLEGAPQGVSKLLMRTGTFKAVSAAAGAEMAQAVIDTFFGSDDTLNGVLNQLGYGVSGPSIKPLA